MKLKLRKADGIAHAALRAIDKIALSGLISISIFEKTAIDSLLRHNARIVLGRLEDVLALQEAVADIRKALAAANQKFGIDDLLTEKNMLDRQETSITKLASRTDDDYGTVEDKPEIVTARLAAMRTRSEAAPIYDRQENLNAFVLDTAAIGDLQERLAKIRRRKSEIGDQLLSINVTEEITVSDKVRDLLVKHNVI
jgi:hypothetical protein